MKIYLSPVRMDTRLVASVLGDAIIVNGVSLDFTPLLDGETLPLAAVDNVWIAGDAHRISGEIVLTLKLPHGSNAPESTRFPAAYEVPMTVLDGEVPLPPYDSEVQEAQS